MLCVVMVGDCCVETQRERIQRQLDYVVCCDGWRLLCPQRERIQRQLDYVVCCDGLRLLCVVSA